MANSFRNDTYRSAKGLSYFVIILLAAVGIVSLLYVILSFVTILFPDLSLDLDDGGSLNAGLAVVGLLSLVEIPLRLICAVFFLIWLYRSYNNLSALKARNLEFSPGWAVGWWFIPFANLVKPFQVIRELFNESDSNFDEESGFLNIANGTPPEVGFWWAAFLLSGFIYRVSDAFYGKGDLPQSVYFPVVFLAAALLAVAAAALAVYIVFAVAKRQDTRYAILTRSAETNEIRPPLKENVWQ